MFKLVVQEGETPGKEYTLKDRMTVGRLSTNDIFVQDIHASRTNSRIERGDDGVYIEDLGSTCGTVVNGRKVKRVRLTPGDRVTIGNTVLCLVDTAAPPPLPPPGPGAGPGAGHGTGKHGHEPEPGGDREIPTAPVRSAHLSPPRPVPFRAPTSARAATARDDEDTAVRRKEQGSLPAAGGGRARLERLVAGVLFVVFLAVVLFAAKWVGARIAAKVLSPG
ncbi:MAG: FHA domain-containing protein [Planctomycetes bacterium]|nr:FHA domain-containing protein [Planctomycetota bacterium]